MTKPKVHLIPVKRTGDLPKQSDKSAYTTSKFVPRKKRENEALVPSRDIWSQGTYDGHDLRPFEGRPGSMVAYSLPSHGDRT